NSKPGPGKYLLGDAAYAQWIDDLKNADTFTAEEREQLFQPSWWAFCVLFDARQSAAGYLKRVAAEFDDAEVRAALERAAGHYGQSAKAGGRAFMAKDVFLGPWSGKAVADWTKEMRSEEAALLSTM